MQLLHISPPGKLAWKGNIPVQLLGGLLGYATDHWVFSTAMLGHL
jgi:hypothetical protein